MPDTTLANAVKLKHIFDIYGLEQLITEPTRVTRNSSTLIDLCITNSPPKITKCGVVQLAISTVAHRGHAIHFLNSILSRDK